MDTYKFTKYIEFIKTNLEKEFKRNKSFHLRINEYYFDKPKVYIEYEYNTNKPFRMRYINGRTYYLLNNGRVFKIGYNIVEHNKHISDYDIDRRKQIYMEHSKMDDYVTNNYDLNEEELKKGCEEVKAKLIINHYKKKGIFS